MMSKADEFMAEQFGISIGDMESISTILENVLEGNPLSYGGKLIRDHISENNYSQNMIIAISYMAGTLAGQIMYSTR